MRKEEGGHADRPGSLNHGAGGGRGCGAGARIQSGKTGSGEHAMQGRGCGDGGMEYGT